MPALHFARRAKAGLYVPTPVSTPSVNYGSDIYAWCRQAGGQVLTVPNGYYSAGTYNPANAPTRAVVTTNNLTDADHSAAGTYGGYLILQAQTPGQVIVDMSAPGTALPGGVNSNGDMYLSGQYVGGTTTKIIFSGFKFQNGAITNAATNIHFWYPEVTHPFAHWSAETGYGNNTNYHGTNDCLFLTFGCVNTRWYGAYFHDIGTGPTLQNGVRSVRMTGFKVGAVDHGGRYDLIHPDALAFLGGNIWNNDFADFDINATTYGLGVNNQNLSGTWNGGVTPPGSWTSLDSSNNTFSRGWIHGCAGAGFQVNCFRKMNGDATINNGTFDNVHIWGNGTIDGGQNNGAYQYIQSVDTSQGITYTVGANPQPTRITYTTTNSDSLVAQVGTDPATAWQNTAGHSSSLADLLALFTALGWPT